MLSRRKDSLNCKRNKLGILDKRAVMSFGKLFSDRVSYVNIVFRNLNECVFIFGLSTFQNYRLVFDLSHPSLAVTFIPQRDIQLTRLMSTWSLFISTRTLSFCRLLSWCVYFSQTCGIMTCWCHRNELFPNGYRLPMTKRKSNTPYPVANHHHSCHVTPPSDIVTALKTSRDGEVQICGNGSRAGFVHFLLLQN